MEQPRAAWWLGRLIRAGKTEVVLPPCRRVGVVSPSTPVRRPHLSGGTDRRSRAIGADRFRWACCSVGAQGHDHGFAGP